jgi:hypothetical protein
MHHLTTRTLRMCASDVCVTGGAGNGLDLHLLWRWLYGSVNGLVVVKLRANSTMEIVELSAVCRVNDRLEFEAVSITANFPFVSRRVESQCIVSE